MITLDIETHGVEDGAPLLPKPVGIAIRWPDGRKEYMAFGHPTGNNCDWDHAKSVITLLWGEEWLTHNGATFDVPILQHYFDLPPRNPLLTHDTLFLAYLHNPHARSLSLKDLAVDWLGMDKDAQTEMNDWIVKNVPGATRKTAGAFIAMAPAELVGRYAKDDVEMTHRLFEFVHPLVCPLMQDAYDRERRLAPILADMQNIGVRCDLPRLRDDLATAELRLAHLDSEARILLNNPTLNPGSSDEIVVALKANGYSGFLATPKGAESASKKSLDHVLTQNPALRAVLGARSTYATLTGTFMRPWMEIATANKGRIHAAYNQVRNPEGFGTRTGRLSSSRPNFQNVPGFLGPEFPLMKSYLYPDEGHVWTKGDFMAQEPRLAAHFEDGALCRAFNENPLLDPYIFVLEMVGNITRKESKTVLLGLLYAMGAAVLADRLGCDAQRATMLRNMIKAALPDIVLLDNACKRRFKLGASVCTLGGRHYFSEPASNGRSWDYKALNTLIQGSAADQTKEALIFAHKEIKLLDKSCRILGTVHDEFSISHPPEFTTQVHEIMQLAANYLPVDVPMMMEIHTGERWAEAA